MSLFFLLNPKQYSMLGDGRKPPPGLKLKELPEVVTPLPVIHSEKHSPTIDRKLIIDSDDEMIAFLMLN